MEMRNQTRRRVRQTPDGLRVPLGLEWPSQRVVFANGTALKKRRAIKTCRGKTRAKITGSKFNSEWNRVVDSTTSNGATLPL